MNNVKVHWVGKLAREGEYATPQRRQQGQDGQCPYLPATLLSLASASNVAALPNNTLLLDTRLHYCPYIVFISEPSLTT